MGRGLRLRKGGISLGIQGGVGLRAFESLSLFLTAFDHTVSQTGKRKKEAETAGGRAAEVNKRNKGVKQQRRP